MTMPRFLIAAAFAAAATAASGAAPAPASPDETHGLTVSYADLDMSGAAGRARFRQRLYVAARAVCRRPAPIDFWHDLEFRACRSRSFTEAWNRYAARVSVAATRDHGTAAGMR
jgi:UrcA family protein